MPDKNLNRGRPDPSDLCEIAKMKILENRSVTEIAVKFGIDHRHVDKLLKRGLEQELWTLLIREQPLEEIRKERQNFETRLVEWKKLVQEARVLEGVRDAFEHPGSAAGEGSASNSIAVANMARCAAEVLHGLIKQTEEPRIAVAWGRLTHDIIQQMGSCSTRQKLTAYTMLGIVGIRDAVELQRREALYNAFELARRYGGSCRPIASPAIVRKEEWENLRTMSGVRDVLSEAYQANIVVTALGFVNKDSSEMADTSLLNQQLLTKEELQILAGDYQAVGEIGCSFYDVEGNDLKLPSGKVLVGLDIEHLRAIKARGGKVLAVCGYDHRRVPALLGALRANVITHLVTDHLTCQAMRQRDTEFF